MAVNRKTLLLISAAVGGYMLLIAPRANAVAVVNTGANPAAPDGAPAPAPVTSPADNKSLAAALISEHNTSGWFSRDGRSEKDVLAIFKIESNYNPLAINSNDGQGGAWGIGQILADIARIDYGIYVPTMLLDRRLGVRISMRHMRFVWGDLSTRLGKAPTKSQWIMAYNAGSRAVSEGRGSAAYLAKFTAARAVI